MTGIAATPRLIKGAIIALDPANPVDSVVIFQYNPSDLRRSLSPKLMQGSANPADTLRLAGAPTEVITATLNINASDQLARGDSTAQALGIYPQLSALEMLLYPKSAQVIANTALSALGTMEVLPPRAPLTLFVWGAKRVAPVFVDSLEITEQYHDAALNPVIAEVVVSLRVLTYDDFEPLSGGYAAFLGYQIVKETLAVIGATGNIAGLAGGG